MGIELEDVLKSHGLFEASYKRDYKIYGFKITRNADPEDSVTYIEDAIGMTPATNPSAGAFDGGSWLDVYPFNQIRPVSLDETGTVLFEIDQNDFAKNVDGVTPNLSLMEHVMIEIPPVYWKFTKTPNGCEVRWSNVKVDNTYQALAHERGGVLKGNLYVGAYETYMASNTLYSKRDVSPYRGKAISYFRTYAKNIGEGFGIINFHTLTLLQILFVTMFKSLDSQTALGSGFSDTDSVYNTGYGDTNGMYYGYKASGGDSMKFMGLENFIGNTNEHVDGILYVPENSTVLISDNSVFNDTGDGYIYSIPYTNLSANGYIKATLGEQLGAFLPSEVSGTSSTYYCDYHTRSASTDILCALTFGGDYNDTTKGGIFMTTWYVVSGAPSNVTSSRIQYLAP